MNHIKYKRTLWLKAAVLLSAFFATVLEVHAVTCTEFSLNVPNIVGGFPPRVTTKSQVVRDWDARCDLPVWEATRCANVEKFKYFCSNTTDGCAEVGGCFGETPPGHWYPFEVNGTVKRCKCGCFAQETEFSGTYGPVDFEELRNNPKVELLALSSYQGRLDSQVQLSNITVGKEAEDVYTFSTESGKQITLTSAHPIVISDNIGQILVVKQAQKVEKSDILLDIDRNPERIVSIVTHSYANEVVNFNVSSNNAAEHIIGANGLMMGDNAWQQRLVAEDSRILARAELARKLTQ